MSKDILIMVGSENRNVALAEKFQESFTELGKESEVVNLVNLNLPLYSTSEENKGKPEIIQYNLEKYLSCKAMVFVIPEYNGGIPPVVNNFIAWMSRSTDNWRSVFNGKPVIIASHSGGGGWHGLMALRSQLSYIGMNVLGRQIVVNSGKPLSIDSVKSTCDSLSKLIH